MAVRTRKPRLAASGIRHTAGRTMRPPTIVSATASTIATMPTANAAYPRLSGLSRSSQAMPTHRPTKTVHSATKMSAPTRSAPPSVSIASVVSASAASSAQPSRRVLVKLLFQARGVVARLLGRRPGAVEVRLGLLGLVAGVLGGGERGLEALGGALGGLLRAVELAFARPPLGARLT